MLLYLLLAALAVLIILGITQLVLPPFLAGKVEDRLEARGGTAHVDLDAVPAVRLLAHDGDRFELDGRGLEFPLDQDQSVFDKLDGFDEVNVRLADVKAGPFTVRKFALTRDDGQSDYVITSAGTSSVAQVSTYLSSGLPPLFSSLLAGLSRGVTGKAADQPIPFTLDARFASDGGEPRFVSGTGSVAGIPAGPFAALLVQSVVSRL
jgi:hypothetical protein